MTRTAGSAALVSPFPNVRENAAWFGTDLVCNKTQRQTVYSQVPDASKG